MKRRIAGLYAPALPLQAALRAEPDLDGAPLVVIEGPGPRAAVLAASPAARAAGARPGMTAAQARAAAGELVVRASSEAAIRSASDALRDVGRAFAVRVERAAPDLVYLEVGDLQELFPSESGLCAALDLAARKVGLAVRVGVAGTKAAARLAALRSEDGGATLVPPGEERSYLAALPVELAAPGAELGQALQRFGLRTLGDVAALPGPSWGRRLGREGAALWRIARGEDDEPLRAEPEPQAFSEGVDLDYALEESEPLCFLLSGQLSRLTARMEARGLACAGFSLTLALAPRGTESRDVTVAAPTTEAAVLLTLARLSLEERPPPGPVRGLAVTGGAVPARPAQLSLFGPVLPAPDRLAATVAKLAARFGAERVGAPGWCDSLHPDTVKVDPFAPPPAPIDGTLWRGLQAAAARSPPPQVFSLRRISPPRAARLEIHAGDPVTLDGEPLTHAAGPWRIAVEWWSSAPCARDYYDLETAQGALYRVYREGEGGGWFVDGVYD